MEHTGLKPQRKMLSILEHIAATTLWNHSLSKSFQYSMLFISNIQIIALILQSRLDYFPAYQGIAKPLSVALNLSTMREIIINGINDRVVETCIALGSVYFLLFFVIFCWIIESYFSNKKLSKTCQQIVTILGQIHLSFSFVATNLVFIGILQNQSTSSALKSWIELILISVILILNFFSGIFLAFFSYDPFTKLNILSCHSTRFQVITFILKACLTLANSLVGDSEIAYYLATGLSTAFLALRHYDLLINFPFYHYHAMKVTLLINSVCLGTSCANIIGLSLKQDEIYTVDDIVYIEIVFTILTYWFWNSEFNKKVLHSLQLSERELNSEGKVLKKLFAVTHFMTHTKLALGNDTSISCKEIYFWSIMVSIIDQLNNSSDQDYILPENENNIDNVTILTADRNQFQEIKEKVTRNLLRTAMEKLRKSNKIKIMLLSDYVGDSKYITISIAYLVSLSRSSGFKTRIIVSKLKSRLEDNLLDFFEDQKKKELDVKAFVDFEVISEKFVRMIYTNTQTHLTFWKNYSKPDIQIKGLCDSSKLFEANHNKIHQCWTQEIQPNRLFSSLLIDVYHIYLSHIRNLPVTASKLHNKVAVFNGWRDETMVNSHGTLVLHISMLKERPGNILYISPHVEEVTGRSSQRLIGKSINTLIPFFMRERHEEIVRKHLEDMKDPANSDLLGHTTDIFILDESGNILPCKIHLSLSPHIQGELVYIAVIKVKHMEKADDYLIMGKDGYVHAFTENIGYNLSLATGKRIFMPEICQNYHELKNTIIRIEKGHTHPDDSFNNSSKSVNSVKPPKFLNHSLNPLSLNMSLSFHRYKSSTQDFLCHDTQITSHTFCNVPMYILRVNKISKQESKDDSKSGILINMNKKDTEPESELGTSSNRVFEENLNECAKPLPVFEPPSSLRQNSSRPLIEMTPRLQNEVPHLTDIRLLSLEKSEPDKALVFSPKARKAKQKRNVRKEDGFEDRFELEKFDKDQSVSVFASKEHNKKIENAIHFVWKDRKLQVLKLLGLALILVSSAAVLGWQVNNDKTLGYVSGNIELLSQTKYMLVQLIRLNRISRFVVLIDEGLLDPRRYLPWAIVTNLKATVAGPIKSLASSANVYSNNIQDALYKIDPTLRQKLYETKYTINYGDNITDLQATQQANIFDLVTEIVSAGLKAGNAEAVDFSGQNPSVQFVLNNTLNDLLIGGEMIIPVLIEDGQAKLEWLITSVAVIFSVMALFSVIIGRTVYIIVSPFVKSRNHFIDVLMILENEPIEEHISMVNRFILAIERSHFSSRSEHLNADKQYFKPLKTRLQNAKIKKKIVDKRDIHKSLCSHSLVILLFMIVVLAIYLILYLLTTLQTNSILNKVSLMTTSEHYLYELVLLYCMQYAYINLNKSTTVRGRPIEQEWIQTYQNLTEAQNFFPQTFLSENEGIGMSDRSVQIVKGNLCGMMDVNPATVPLCTILGGGILESGIVNMNSFHLSSFQDTISTFDNSQGTNDELVEILNNQNIAIEDTMSYYFTDKAYLLVTDLMQELLKEDIDKFQNWLKALIYTYLVVCGGVGIVVWVQICNSLEKEMSSWKKIIRQIPWEVIISNKFLKRLLSIS